MLRLLRLIHKTVSCAVLCYVKLIAPGGKTLYSQNNNNNNMDESLI